jgi:Ser/Thr protein kinase RdoA (MazF antagonist)
METEVAEWIAARYDLGSLIAPIDAAARGEQGRVWRFETDHGGYAVKELFVARTESDAAADVDYQEAVLRSASVPMPRPVRAATGEVLAATGGHLIRVYEWVDLLPSSTELDPALVGRTIAAIHRVQHHPARPADPWYSEPVGAVRWHQLSRQVSATGAPFADAFAAEIPTLIELEGLVRPLANLQNCHRDLWADNVLPTTSGGVCVIDWENCGLADPGQELAMVLFDFAYRDRERSRILYDAYVDADGIGRLPGPSSFTMVIAQFGHFYEMAAEEWLRADATDHARAHAISRFDELLARPLDLEVIDATLDSVA